METDILSSAVVRAIARDLSVPDLIRTTETLKQSGQAGAVETLYAAWVQHNPGHPLLYAVLFNQAVTLTDAGDLAQARGCLERAIALNPDFMPAYINLGRVHERHGERRAGGGAVVGGAGPHGGRQRAGRHPQDHRPQPERPRPGDGQPGRGGRGDAPPEPGARQPAAGGGPAPGRPPAAAVRVAGGAPLGAGGPATACSRGCRRSRPAPSPTTRSSSWPWPPTTTRPRWARRPARWTPGRPRRRRPGRSASATSPPTCASTPSAT